MLLRYTLLSLIYNTFVIVTPSLRNMLLRYTLLSLIYNTFVIVTPSLRNMLLRYRFMVSSKMETFKDRF